MKIKAARITAGLLITALGAVTGYAFKNNANDRMIVAHVVAANSDQLRIIVIPGHKVQEHMAHGDWVAPYNDELHKLLIVGADDEGASRRGGVGTHEEGAGRVIAKQVLIQVLGYDPYEGRK